MFTEPAEHRNLGNVDVVVRSPHGDADVEIVSAPVTTTLGDLLTMVTGQAPPPVARVGARVVGTSQRLDSIGLHVGAVIDSRPVDAAQSAPGSDDERTGRRTAANQVHNGGVDLLQLTGRGAGAIRNLPLGRYRIGAGRRLNADELEQAPVESEAFEIEVRADGERHTVAGAAVVVTPGGRVIPTERDRDPVDGVSDAVASVLEPTLDGNALAGAATWTSGRLSVAGRVFQLAPAHHAVPDAEHDRLEPDERGAIPYQRAPVLEPAEPALAVAARRRAIAPGYGLWATRRGDDGAYAFAFGLDPSGHDVVLDLQTHTTAALIGSERFVAALARTILVEAATLHGPSDLRIVIASTPERIGQWDWAKWLPHVRVGGDPLARPLLLADHDELAEWVARATRPPTEPTTTLLVLDNPALWTQRRSPLHGMVAEPPAHVRTLSLCADRPEAPGGCTVTIDEHAPESMEVRQTREGASLVGSLARMQTTVERVTDLVDPIRPALVTADGALDIALAIAAFDDLDVVRQTTAGSTIQPPSIAELVDQRPDRDGDGLSVPVGIHDDHPGGGIGAPLPPRRTARVDLASARTALISCDDREVHDALVASMILGAAATHRSDRLAILTVGSERPAWHDGVPHLAGHVDRASPDDPSRLIHRVAHVLTSEPMLDVLVVIEDAVATTQPIHTGRGATPIDLAAGILELVESLSRVHVVLTTELPLDDVDEVTRSRCRVEMEMSGPAEHPRGVLSDGESRLPVLGPTRVGATADAAASKRSTSDRGLRLLPCVKGRAMTPLERRVERVAKQAAESAPDQTEAREVARRVAEQADAAASAGALLPPPLPTSVLLSRLLDDHEGDGVPIGLLDRPEHAGHEAYWWRPGPHGSLLTVGSPRSGVADIIDLITVGLAARLSPDDVVVHAIEPLPQRRRAFAALPHTARAVSTDEAQAARDVIADVADLLARRRGAGKRNIEDEQRDVVLTVGDLGRLRRWLPDEVEAATLEQLATIGADGPAHGVNLVCVATRADDLGPLVRLAGDRLVGTVQEAGDRRRLGVPTPGPADRHAGRCWSVDAERRVQLATPPGSVDVVVERLVAHDAGDIAGTGAVVIDEALGRPGDQTADRTGDAASDTDAAEPADAPGGDSGGTPFDAPALTERTPS